MSAALASRGSTGSPQSRIPPGRLEPEVAVRPGGRHTAARGAIQETNLDQKRFVNVLDRVFLFTDGRGNRVQSHGPAAKLLDDRLQQLAIHVVETVLVDFQKLQAGGRHR